MPSGFQKELFRTELQVFAFLVKHMDLLDWAILYYVIRKCDAFDQEWVTVTPYEVMNGRSDAQGRTHHRGLPMSDSTAKRHLKKLVEQGYLQRRRTQVPGTKMNAPNQFAINFSGIEGNLNQSQNEEYDMPRKSRLSAKRSKNEQKGGVRKNSMWGQKESEVGSQRPTLRTTRRNSTGRGLLEEGPQAGLQDVIKEQKAKTKKGIQQYVDDHSELPNSKAVGYVWQQSLSDFGLKSISILQKDYAIWKSHWKKNPCDIREVIPWVIEYWSSRITDQFGWQNDWPEIPTFPKVAKMWVKLYEAYLNRDTAVVFNYETSEHEVVQSPLEKENEILRAQVERERQGRIKAEQERGSRRSNDVQEEIARNAVRLRKKKNAVAEGKKKRLKQEEETRKFEEELRDDSLWPGKWE